MDVMHVEQEKPNKFDPFGQRGWIFQTVNYPKMYTLFDIGHF